MTSARIHAPKEGRAKTRLNWILRQLKDTPSDLRVEVHYARTRTTTSGMVDTAKTRPEVLLLPDDTRREPTAFTIAMTGDMGAKRGKTRGSFADDTMRQTLDFYGEALQKVSKWTPPAPKLKKVDESDIPPEPTSTGEAHEPPEAESQSLDQFKHQESSIESVRSSPPSDADTE